MSTYDTLCNKCSSPIRFSGGYDLSYSFYQNQNQLGVTLCEKCKDVFEYLRDELLLEYIGIKIEDDKAKKVELQQKFKQTLGHASPEFNNVEWFLTERVKYKDDPTLRISSSILQLCRRLNTNFISNKTKRIEECCSSAVDDQQDTPSSPSYYPSLPEPIKQKRITVKRSSRNK